MRKQIFPLIGLVLLASFILVSCKKETSLNTQEIESSAFNATNSMESNPKKVYVKNVDELYAAINDPANIGSKIVLAPGTYLLDASYPKAGRLELLADMSLTGQPGKPEQVIIDGSGLPATSFSLPTIPSFPGAIRTGVIRMGNGSNAIEWLSVKGSPLTAALSAIETDLITTPIAHVRVAHCIVTGGQIGINIRNRDPQSNGRIIEAEILNNEITENLAGFGQGVGIQNARNVTAAVIRANLRGNYVHRNRMGIRAFNVVSNQCAIFIQSTDDRFEENGLGLALLGAFNEFPNFTANDNYVLFEASGTTVMNNIGVPAPPPGSAELFTGGMMAIGAMVSVNSFPGRTSYNKLDIKFWGCRFEGNVAPYDINAFGARSTYPSASPAGTNNVVNIHLNGISANATVNVIPSFPSEPAGTNTINVYR
jgi:hypothetical protein